MKDIVIYPSSWYYNACIQGFLETLAWGLGKGEEGERIVQEIILQGDGSAKIPAPLAEAIFNDDSYPMPQGYTCSPAPDGLKKMKRVARWWVEKSFEDGFVGKDYKGKKLDPLERVDKVCNKLFSKNCLYENLAQSKWEKIKKIDFLNNWFKNNEHLEGEERISCSFCGEAFIPDPDLKARVLDLYFTRSMSSSLGSSLDGFPNLFWDGKPSLPMCKICRSYFLYFHFIDRNGLFINAGSFFSNWHLNRLISGKLKGKTSGYHVALLEAMRLDPQLRRGISGWGLQNMEIVLFKNGNVYYYPLSARVAKLLLIPQITALLSKFVKNSNQKKADQPIVWECVIKERFDYLPIAIYKTLRYFLTGTDSKGGDAEIISASLSDFDLISDAAELYIEIIKNLSREKGGADMSYINIRELKNAAATAPLSFNDSKVFRLLELTRLNRKADVYHLLLREYVVIGMLFPEVLAKLFAVRDDEVFKTGIYSFISGLPRKTEAEEKSE